MPPLDPRLVRRSATVRHHLAWSVALGALTAALVIAIAWCVAHVVAARFAGAGIGLLAIAVLAAYVVRAAIAWGHGIVSERASIRVKAELRRELVDDLADPRRIGPRPSSARLVTILGPGMDAFDGYIGRFLPQLALAVLVPAAVIVAVAWTDPLSGLIIALTLPLIGVFMALVGLLTAERVQRRWAAMEKLGRHFGDVLNGLVVFKIFGRRQEAGIGQIGERHRAESMAALRLAFLSTLVLELVSTISVALVAVSVGLRVVDDELTLVDAMFVLLLAPEAYLPVRRVGSLFHDSQEGVEATAALLDVLDHDRHEGTAPAPEAPATIRMRGVEVVHEGREHPSLQLADLHVAPRERVALAGPSGCGKSTALAVLLAFQRPRAGAVTVDGVDLFEIDPQQWRRQVAWVPQSPHVVGGTLADNVALAVPRADRHDVDRALRDVGLDRIDPSRVLTEGDGGLSAGERRRLALARAVLRVRHGGAWLLVLDEPTAGLDAELEARVVAILATVGVSILVVSHRADTLALADRTVTLAAQGVAV